MKSQLAVLYICCFMMFSNGPALHSQGPQAVSPNDDEKPSPGNLNIKLPTLGGKQFWTDYEWRRGWRIQRNAWTGHWRLLDPAAVRHAWGSRAACEATLRLEQPENSVQSDQFVILVHGLMRSSSSMTPVGRALEEALDCTTIRFEYASTRGSISEHAAALRELISRLPADQKISFVGHSMGNIILRHAIGDWQRSGDEATLARIQAIVMLGPPNQGAAIARQLSKLELFEWITGESGQELGPRWKEFESQLAIPHCPFGIIAGRLPESLPDNPLVGEAGDFIVSVEETKLKGAADFLEVPRLHSLLMNDPVVQKAVVQFMKTHRFQ